MIPVIIVYLFVRNEDLLFSLILVLGLISTGEWSNERSKQDHTDVSERSSTLFKLVGQ